MTSTVNRCFTISSQISTSSVFTELTDFRVRRIAHFKKNLVDLAELELKHARVSLNCVVTFCEMLPGKWWWVSHGFLSMLKCMKVHYM